VSDQSVSESTISGGALGIDVEDGEKHIKSVFPCHGFACTPIESQSIAVFAPRRLSFSCLVSTHSAAATMTLFQSLRGRKLYLLMKLVCGASFMMYGVRKPMKWSVGCCNSLLCV
jgi:hypothetical protein